MKMIVETLWLILLYHLKIVRADTWSFKLKHKYPLSSKISLTLLNIFYGPRVESSSSVVCDVVNKKFDRMVVSITLPFKQSIIAWMLKHLLLTLSNLNQVQVFQMLDRRKSPPHSVYWSITPLPPPPQKKHSPPQYAHYGPVMIDVDESIRNSKEVYENVLVEINWRSDRKSNKKTSSKLKMCESKNWRTLIKQKKIEPRHLRYPSRHPGNVSDKW